LSILVIVSLSVTATCSLYYFGLETEHIHGHDCRNSGHTIADLELRAERHRLYIFFRLVHVTHFVYSSF